MKQKKLTQKEILSFFENEKIFEKTARMLAKAKITGANGLKFTGFRFEAEAAANYTCDKRVTKVINEGGVQHIVRVCVKWSDGQDHSNDPDVPDTP